MGRGQLFVSLAEHEPVYVKQKPSGGKLTSTWSNGEPQPTWTVKWLNVAHPS